MPTPINLLSVIVFTIVMLCWLTFGGAFFLLKRTDGSVDRKREPASLIGFGLQILGMSWVWFVRRPWFTPISQTHQALEILLAAIAIVTSIFSAWMTIAAIRVLGKQW